MCRPSECQPAQSLFQFAPREEEVPAVATVGAPQAGSADAAALAAVPNQIAGSAAALLGSLQYGSGIVSSLLLAAFSSGTPFTMAWIIVLFVGLSAVMTVWQEMRKSDNDK